jgi:hypothetical protein
MSNLQCRDFLNYSVADMFIKAIRLKTSSVLTQINVKKHISKFIFEVPIYCCLLTWPDLLGLHLVTHFVMGCQFLHVTEIISVYRIN